MNRILENNWKSLVKIAKSASEFSGKTGDSYNGRGYFPNKNVSRAVKMSIDKDALMQGKALVKKFESIYEQELDYQKGTRYMDVPKKMIKHKFDDKVGRASTIHFINTENKMKTIFGESKMKKSKFKQLIRGMVSDMLEGKGSAPGSQTAGTGSGFATPGAVSKGGFTLQDFGKVLGGVAGRRTRGKSSGSSGFRTGIRTSKHSLFKGGRDVDQWRLDALRGGESAPKAKYQTTKSKSRNVSTNISSLAAIRQTDYDFIKAAGGRKTGTASARMRVSAKYIGQKSQAITQYTAIIDAEKTRLNVMVSTVVAGGGTGTIEHQALLNLIGDLDLRQAEYVLKWDYATQAYAGDTAGMQNVRNSLETNRNSRLKRSKSVGRGTYSPIATWSERGSYRAGDVVTDGGVQYTAVGRDERAWAGTQPSRDARGSVWQRAK